MSDMLKEFYNGKRVVVTGGLGFVGSHLAERLVQLGASQVYLLDDMSRGINQVKGAVIVKADANADSSCRYAFLGAEAKIAADPVDVVFNLAANVAGVLHNQRNNMTMFQSNVGLQTVAPWIAGEVGVKHFLQVSSVCIYAPENQAEATESDGMIGDPHFSNGGYAWSKRVGEKIAELSDVEHVVIVRPSNIYGPRDYFDEKAHVIPAFIKRAHEQQLEKFILYGSPGTVREFLYVTDAAEGMLYAMAFGDNRGIYNIGTNGETKVTMIDLAQRIKEKLGDKRPVKVVNEFSSGDSYRSSNAIRLNALGWKPQVKLDRGLEETIKWYLNQQS